MLSTIYYQSEHNKAVTSLDSDKHQTEESIHFSPIEHTENPLHILHEIIL